MSKQMLELAEELREYTAMKYAGDCKCGKCQLVPRALVERIYHALNSTTIRSSADSESVVKELAAWLIALEDASMYEPVPQSLIERGRTYIFAGASEKHSGDCTRESHTCVVCFASDAIAKAKQILAALHLAQPQASAISAEAGTACKNCRHRGSHLAWRCDACGFEVKRPLPTEPQTACEDPTASKKWNDGCDFAMTQLCKFLDVEPNSVSWDAATETVEGDVSAVIGNILRAKFGEDWGPQCQAESASQAALCDDCPPEGYPTDKTRCTPCPLRAPHCQAVNEPQTASVFDKIEAFAKETAPYGYVRDNATIERFLAQARVALQTHLLR